MGTLKPAPDLFLSSVVGADYYGAGEHRRAAIVAHRGRVFLREDFEKRFHVTHRWTIGRQINLGAT